MDFVREVARSATSLTKKQYYRHARQLKANPITPVGKRTLIKAMVDVAGMLKEGAMDLMAIAKTAENTNIFSTKPALLFIFQ
jgi:hypothetical protein